MPAIATDYPTLFGCEHGAGARVVVIGLPYDRGTAPEHTGAATAPQLIRLLSAPETLCVKRGVLYDLERREVVFPGHVLSDLGDIKFRANQSDDDYQALVTQAVALIAREEKNVLLIGGDHLITLFALRGLARAGRRFQVIQLDAHHDYDAVAVGERPTHATFISFVVAERLAEKVIQLGIRGLSWGAPNPPDNVVQGTLESLEAELIPGVDVYLTVDTDAFDPSIAPAVHYPETAGLKFGSLQKVLDILRSKELRGIGADWTEYSPSLDATNRLTGRFILRGLAEIVRYLSEGNR